MTEKEFYNAVSQLIDHMIKEAKSSGEESVSLEKLSELSHLLLREAMK